MNTSPPSIQDQLLARVTQFQKNFPNITQAEIARYCRIGEANFSAAIAGRRGLSANSVLQLHKLLGLPRHEVIKKFSSQPGRSSKIVSFQSRGQSMQLDNDGWVAREGSTGDPVNSTDITSTTDAITSQVADLVSVFKGLDYVTRKTVLDSFVKAHASANSIPTS